MTKSNKISNLLACYTDLASGEPLEHLLQKYVKVEVLVAQELFEKGISLRQLEDFVRRRGEHVKAMLGESDEHSTKYTIPSERKVIRYES